MWMLGIQPRFFGRAVDSLNLRAISPAPVTHDLETDVMACLLNTALSVEYGLLLRASAGFPKPGF